jgi:hypothetical protein
MESARHEEDFQNLRWQVELGIRRSGVESRYR